MHLHTPLYSEHIALSAKMGPFAGYDMPIQYASGVIKEHEWTRERAGLFDVSHMGQAVVSGAGAAEFLSRLTPSSFLKAPVGRAKYTVLTNEQGGIIDDLIVTRMAEEAFFVVFNAGRKAIDIAWFKKHLPPGVTFAEMADHALVALQGPKAEAVLAKEFTDSALAAMPYMTMKQAHWNGIPVGISRLGYTGEDGFEISVPASQAVAFWHALLAHGDVQPIGLAARDSLRLEMGYPLYGHDLTEDITPVEAGLGWVMRKGHQTYIGADHMPAVASRKRIGVALTEPGIAREGCAIYVEETRVGELTSGGFSPTLKRAIGQGYVADAYAHNGQKIHVEVRGKKIAAEIVALPFVPAKTKPSTLEPSKEKKYG